MFETNQISAKIFSENNRTEKHGDKEVPTMDIGFRFTTDNSILDLLHPNLKASLYKKSEAKQGEIIEDLRALKFGNLLDMPIKWKYEGVGYETYLDYGMDGKQQLHFIDNTVDTFKLEIKDGGSVTISLRVIAHPTEEEAGKLYGLNGSEVLLSLMAPSREDHDDDAQENLI